MFPASAGIMQRGGSHRGDLAAPIGGAVALNTARCASTLDRADLRAIASGDAISALLLFVGSKYPPGILSFGPHRNLLAISPCCFAAPLQDPG
jgi:hypothetical protein